MITLQLPDGQINQKGITYLNFFFFRSKSDIVPLLLKETPPQRVTFVEELGQGAFGKVHKGILRDLPKVDVFFKPREQKVEIKEGKVVAIKVLLGEQTHDQQQRIINKYLPLLRKAHYETKKKRCLILLITNFSKLIDFLYPLFV